MFVPVITYILIGVTCLFSYQAFNNTSIFHRYLFNPYQINNRKEWYRFFTHAALHANYLHLFVNMYALYLFGSIMERVFCYPEMFGRIKGEFFYILMYVGAVMISSLPSFEKHKNNMYYNAVGASGAVSAVVFSYILVDPTGGIGLMFVPGIYIPSFIFGVLYLIYSYHMAKRGRDNIGHDAHFWGAVFGVVFTGALKFQLVTSFVPKITRYMDQLLHN
jgi:membrane associated rhomboid family serine protease